MAQRGRWRPGAKSTRLARVRGAWLGALLLFGCGELILRSLDLSIEGLSGRAARLVIGVYPQSLSPGCRDLELDNVKALEPPVVYVWERGQPDRRVTLEPVEEEGLMILVYSEDDQGAPIQFGCREIAYKDLETPEVQLQLSARPMD